jgi:hypothetical protein
VPASRLPASPEACSTLPFRARSPERCSRWSGVACHRTRQSSKQRPERDRRARNQPVQGVRQRALRNSPTWIQRTQSSRGQGRQARTRQARNQRARNQGQRAHGPSRRLPHRRLPRPRLLPHPLQASQRWTMAQRAQTRRTTASPAQARWTTDRKLPGPPSRQARCAGPPERQADPSGRRVARRARQATARLLRLQARSAQQPAAARQQQPAARPAAPGSAAPGSSSRRPSSQARHPLPRARSWAAGRTRRRAACNRSSAPWTPWWRATPTSRRRSAAPRPGRGRPRQVRSSPPGTQACWWALARPGTRACSGALARSRTCPGCRPALCRSLPCSWGRSRLPLALLRAARRAGAGPGGPRTAPKRSLAGPSLGIGKPAERSTDRPVLKIAVPRGPSAVSGASLPVSARCQGVSGTSGEMSPGQVVSRRSRLTSARAVRHARSADPSARSVQLPETRALRVPQGRT